MTIADDGKFCGSCKKVGLQRKAHRIMPGEGGAKCDEHFRDISGLPQLNEEAKRFIAQCKEALANPAAGVPHPPGSAAPAVPSKPRASRKKKDKPAEPAAGAVADAQRQFRIPMKIIKAEDKYSDAIDELKKKKAILSIKIEQIDRAIELLREIGT